MKLRHVVILFTALILLVFGVLGLTLTTTANMLQNQANEIAVAGARQTLDANAAAVELIDRKLQLVEQMLHFRFAHRAQHRLAVRRRVRKVAHRAVQ